LSASRPLALRVTAPQAIEDDLVFRLWEMGTLGIQHQPDEDGRRVLLAYFPARARTEAILSAIESLDGVRVAAAEVEDVDWVARFRDGFRPFEAAGFRIVPSWQPGSRPDRDTLLVDPGRAFGTGTHESTRLCLTALRRLAADPGLGRVVDVGTGSGLLAIAALRLGARRAAGVDLDLEALRSARRHAELNRVALPLVAGDGGRALRAACCDTLVANLTAGLLVERSGELSASCSPGGRLVLSGLLAPDLAPVREGYARLRLVDELHEGEWAALVMEPAP
jgi:ribosomal protein L11 methyltransferase